MEEYEKGSKIIINGKEFEIMDIWEGNKTISEDDNDTISDTYFANLKDNKGKMIGPVQLKKNN